MSGTIAERSFMAQAVCIPAITAFVTEYAELAGLKPKKIMQLELVVEEVVINICNYAYEVPDGDVVVRVYSDQTNFIIEFEDGGAGFNPLTAAEPDLTSELEEREAGGLGVFFIRQMTDDVNYRRVEERNILSVTINTGGKEQ